MRLAIYTIQQTLFEGEVEKVIARTTTGEITVLDGHIPLITTLRGPAVEAVDKSGNKNVVKVMSGTLEVRPEGEVVVLSEN